jgi:uncharacterized membrane protein
MKILRSIGAVLAGLVFIVISHNAVDLILEKTGIFTPPEQGFHITWMVVTATIYRVVFSIIGCYITAALAPSRPMLHAMILGLIGLVLSAIAAIVLIPMNLGPAWYPITLAVLSPVCGWLGGRIYVGKRRAAA